MLNRLRVRKIARREQNDRLAAWDAEHPTPRSLAHPTGPTDAELTALWEASTQDWDRDNG